MSTTTSAARIAANRANAQHSTGPKTKAGKARSRANALKHGLTAEVVGCEAIEALAPAVIDTSVGVSPAWLQEQLTRTMAQIDQAHRIERDLHAEAAWRAATVWESDQAAEVNALGAKLSRRPAIIVGTLRRTPAGCDWLSMRWGWLLAAATAPEGWSEAQNQLAFDLLGVDAAFRTLTVSEAVSFRQYPPGPTQSQAEIAEMMLAELTDHRALAVEADDQARRAAEADLVDLPTPALARLRRYENALGKRLYWLIDQLQYARPVPPPTPAPAPAPAPSPVRAETRPSETNPTPPPAPPAPMPVESVGPVAFGRESTPSPVVAPRDERQPHREPQLA